MKKKSTKKLVDEMLTWLKKQQILNKIEDFHHGGFSPYPDVIKAAGVISTAKSLEATILYLKPEGICEDETITNGIKFLLRVQHNSTEGYHYLHDGSFPPMGDLELLFTPVPDATAEAVRVLELYRKLLSEEDLLSWYEENNIKAVVSRGLRWLISYINQNQCYYTPNSFTDSKGIIEVNRVSLNLAIDSCLNSIDPEYYYEFMGMSDYFLEERVKRVSKYIEFLEEHGYLPFNMVRPKYIEYIKKQRDKLSSILKGELEEFEESSDMADPEHDNLKYYIESLRKEHYEYSSILGRWEDLQKPSITNTARGIRLIKEVINMAQQNSVIKGAWPLYAHYYPNEKIEGILEKTKEFIIKNLDEILKHNTEYDPINVEVYPKPNSLTCPSGVYPECYSKIPALLYLSYLLGEDVEVKKIRNKIRKRVTVPICVDRGRKEPSVRSTAMFLIYNKELEKLKRMKEKWRGVE